VERGITREAQQSMYVHRREALVDADLAGSVVEMVDRASPDDAGSEAQQPLTARTTTSSEDEKRNDQLELRDPQGAISPPPPVCSLGYGYLDKKLRFMWTIAKYDNETSRIMRLAVPFTISAMVDTVTELITMAIISNYIGTDSMVVYAMVDVIVGISSSFVGGWIEAISSLGSMAYGAENYELLGQYVQTSCIGYLLGEIPFAFIWGMTIGKIMLLMGFSEDVAVLSQDFVFIRVAINMVMGVNEAVLDFLEVVEKEKYANVMYCLQYVFQLGLVALFTVKLEADLIVLGLVILTNQTLFFFLNVLIPNKMGWLAHFELGLFGQCSFRNKSMVKELFKTALPLAFGSLLAYAEWEILTVFAAVLGPAETATWAVLGFVWDVFESTTSAIGDASEIRCAYQLGKGRPSLAKLSAYKAVFIAAMLAFAITAVFLSLSNILPFWLTKDATIQAMLIELFPLIALGNVTMNMGMVCWAVVGAQGRYRLATWINMGCSMLITVPLGAITTVWLRIDLQGLTFAVVVGYTITAMLLSMIILLSDWEKLSKKIQAKMEDEDDSDSDSDDDSSSSSSSSDSSSSVHQASQGRSIAVGSFVIPPATPGTVVPPPPPIAPDSQARSGTKKHQPYRIGSMQHTAGHVTPPRSPTRRPRSMSASRSLTSESPGRNAMQRPRPRPMTPDQKQAKSLAKLRTLGTEHIRTPNSSGSFHTLGSPNTPGSFHTPGSPNTPGSPRSPTTPVSLGSQCSFGLQTSVYSVARSTRSSLDDPSHRVVKGRRKRIG